MALTPTVDHGPDRFAAPDGDPVVEDLFGGLSEGRADLVDPGSFSVAVMTPSGATRWEDPAFGALIGEAAESLDCRRLLGRAARAGRAAGVVTTGLRGAVVVEVRSRERVGSWPLKGEAVSALGEAGERLLLIAFAPSRAPKLVLVAASGLGLSPREADIAAALLEAPTLEAAAARAGMSVDTAKDALERACRRLGVRGASDLVGRLLDLACGFGGADEAAAGAVLGLTEAEGRVAWGAAKGWSVSRTAEDLGLSEGTVKGYRKAIFAKTGASRDRDLRRLFVEASRLEGLQAAAEVVLEDRAAGERLRVLARPGARRAVLIDYGPARGRPLMAMHGFTTGRRLPAPFVARLQRNGWRPLVVQRPGFGLSDPAVDDYLGEAADDMAAVLDALGAAEAALIARDGGVAVAIAFARRYPERLLRGVLVNPKSTRDRPVFGLHPLSVLSRLLLGRPALIAIVAEGFRRRTADAQVRALLRRLYEGMEADGAALQPEMLDHVVRDGQAMVLRTARGLIDELRLYADGWRVPAALPPIPWRVAWGRAMWSDAEADIWRRAGAKTRVVDGMGLLPAYTHPADLAALLSD